MAAALPALRAVRRIGGPARPLSGPAFRMSRAAYAERQRASLEPGQREAFWLQKAVEELDWFEQPTTAVDLEKPTGRWFPDGVSNLCHNALDRHVAAGLGAKTAISYVSAVGGASRDLTYAELLDDVARFAGGLAALGVEPGDLVLLYMPMIPEAAVAMLACARLGAVHSVVFGGFAARELAARVDAARPKVVVAATCGLEGAKGALPYMPAVDEALALAAHETIARNARPSMNESFRLRISTSLLASVRFWHHFRIFFLSALMSSTPPRSLLVKKTMIDQSRPSTMVGLPSAMSLGPMPTVFVVCLM